MRRRAALLLPLGALLPSPERAAAQPGPSPSVDNLLSALKVAPNEQAAGALESEIREALAARASPAVKLLLARAQRELGEQAAGDALDSFDAALDLEPELVIGWNGRAEARLALGDYAGAVKDIRQALLMEPRNFIAFKQLARVSEVRGDWKGALAAWTKVLELSPKTPGGEERLHDLQRRALGEQL